MPVSPPTNFLPVRLAMLVVAVAAIGCGSSDKPEAGSSAQADVAATSPFATEKIPKLDVRQLLAELPRAFPDSDYVDFPAAGVRIVPPAGLTQAERFHGFRDAESNSSLMITMFPVSYPEATKNYILNVVNDPRLEATSGFTKTLDVDGHEAAFAYFVQDSELGTVAKNLLAFGDEKTTWLLTGVYPQQRQADFAKEVLQSMMSVRSIPGAITVEPGSDVDFMLSAPTLKITPGWTKAVVYTRNGVYPTVDPTDPCFKATPSTETVHVEPDNRKKFALEHIVPSPDISVQNVFIDREITVDGLPGRELMALASDKYTKTPILLYAAVLFEEDSYITLHGWAGQFVEEDWGAEFKAITASLKRK